MRVGLQRQNFSVNLEWSGQPSWRVKVFFPLPITSSSIAGDRRSPQPNLDLVSSIFITAWSDFSQSVHIPVFF